MGLLSKYHKVQGDLILYFGSLRSSSPISPALPEISKWLLGKTGSAFEDFQFPVHYPSSPQLLKALLESLFPGNGLLCVSGWILSPDGPQNGLSSLPTPRNFSSFSSSCSPEGTTYAFKIWFKKKKSTQVLQSLSWEHWPAMTSLGIAIEL